MFVCRYCVLVGSIGTSKHLFVTISKWSEAAQARVKRQKMGVQQLLRASNAPGTTGISSLACNAATAVHHIVVCSPHANITLSIRAACGQHHLPPGWPVPCCCSNGTETWVLLNASLFKLPGRQYDYEDVPIDPDRSDVRAGKAIVHTTRSL